MKELLTNLPLLFGLVAAAIHVFTGPDHLAAIGPLALNAKVRPWLIGIFWGMGHVLGMMIIGVLFFFFRELIPVEMISAHSEKIVGVMLIVIGMWAFYRLYRQMKNQATHLHQHENEDGSVYLHKHEHHHIFEQHEHSNFQKHSLWAALGIGTLHGLAGVSHLLGLLPTLAFASAWQSALYLIGFAAGTLLAMAAFSGVMGMVGKYSSEQRKAFLYRFINGFAGAVAVFVGLFWIWYA
ncbi:MAG: sulfite exporter TauE/SafE family protein [Bacteroidales bacterium]|nr:sulfite exporter TauE/SafE family protein [Bacteroidales bacterium]